MASMKAATCFLREALAAARSGDHLTAARLGLWSMRTATACRARGRDDVALMSYDIAVGRAHRVLEDDAAPQPERSEAGRIKAEAGYLLRQVA